MTVRYRSRDALYAGLEHNPWRAQTVTGTWDDWEQWYRCWCADLYVEVRVGNRWWAAPLVLAEGQAPVGTGR